MAHPLQTSQPRQRQLDRPLDPGGVLGVIGGTYLARTVCIAATRLGFKPHVFTPNPHDAAISAATTSTIADLTHAPALRDFIAECDVVTRCALRTQPEVLAWIASQVPTFPNTETLAASQNRARALEVLESAGATVAPYCIVETEDAVRSAVGALGPPIRYQRVAAALDRPAADTLDTADAVVDAWRQHGAPTAVLERDLKNERQYVLLGARSTTGDYTCWDLAEVIYDGHAPRRVRVPTDVPQPHLEQAQGLGKQIAISLNYVGVFGLHLCITATGLVAREFVAGPTTCGYWTDDACITGQAEQHVRAICGWPLGDTFRHSDVTMTTLLGNEAEAWEGLSGRPQSRLSLASAPSSSHSEQTGHTSRLNPRAVVASPKRH